jgi:hypothetical protein
VVFDEFVAGVLPQDDGTSATEADGQDAGDGEEKHVDASLSIEEDKAAKNPPKATEALAALAVARAEQKLKHDAEDLVCEEKRAGEAKAALEALEAKADSDQKGGPNPVLREDEKTGACSLFYDFMRGRRPRKLVCAI